MSSALRELSPPKAVTSDRSLVQHMNKDVTEAELSVLEAIWIHGRATIRELTDRLYPGGGASSYASVQKLLERLEAKGAVRRERDKNVYAYTALVGKEDVLAHRLMDVAARLCEGSLTPILTHLVASQKLTAAQRQKLVRMLEETARVPSRKGKTS